MFNGSLLDPSPAALPHLLPLLDSPTTQRRVLLGVAQRIKNSNQLVFQLCISTGVAAPPPPLRSQPDQNGEKLGENEGPRWLAFPPSRSH